ncbi:hypothetical protein BDW68DRAFT_80670 [Aspergillus falconensis]
MTPKSVLLNCPLAQGTEKHPWDLHILCESAGNDYVECLYSPLWLVGLSTRCLYTILGISTLFLCLLPTRHFPCCFLLSFCSLLRLYSGLFTIILFVFVRFLRLDSLRIFSGSVIRNA